MRRIATVRRVKKVLPVIGKDGVAAGRVELLSFDDIAWKCVAKKGEFEPGSTGIYIEVSSIVPNVPCFAFMKNSKWTVNTKRFLGTTYSQGLFMPMSILSEFGYITDVAVGTDVTEVIGVKPLNDETEDDDGDFAGRFPTWIISRTGEDRIQSVPAILDEFRGLPVVATEKIDGNSATVYWENGNVVVCSANRILKHSPHSRYWEAVYNSRIDIAVTENSNFVIQGEVIGRGVRPNRTKWNISPTMYVFNVMDRVTGLYFDYNDLVYFCKANRIPCVPTVYIWRSFDASLEDLLEMTRGESWLNSREPREGIVLRPIQRNTESKVLGGKLSVKILNNDFLAKYGG